MQRDGIWDLPGSLGLWSKHSSCSIARKLRQVCPQGRPGQKGREMRPCRELALGRMKLVLSRATSTPVNPTIPTPPASLKSSRTSPGTVQGVQPEAQASVT